jgi:DNA-directed RNA polymerase subunit RPC12/RpoP
LPQKVICQDCGAILYEGLNLKPPDEIILKHDGKCPKCGNKLARVPMKVDVRPVTGKPKK